MDLTNEIVEKHGFKRINNSTWRKGNWTLQNGHTHEGVTIYEKIMNTKKAYKLCIDGKYSQMITSAELLAELVLGREVDAGISKCNKHIVSNNDFAVEKCANCERLGIWVGFGMENEDMHLCNMMGVAVHINDDACEDYFKAK